MTKTIKFRPAVRHGIGGPERIIDEIEGEAIDYGLVLHPLIMPPDGRLHPVQISISCPDTGHHVTSGFDREDALLNLDALVLKKGGCSAFLIQIGAARRRILSAREAAAKAEQPAPFLPTAPAVLGLSESRP